MMLALAEAAESGGARHVRQDEADGEASAVAGLRGVIVARESDVNAQR